MSSAEPALYRRVLSSEESALIWLALERRWGVRGGFWYPVTGELPAHAVAFDANGFDDEFGAARLHSLLQQLGVRRVYELNEWAGESEYEIEISLVTAEYGTAGEMYWTDPGETWLIYASHESSITIAGESLIAALKEAWPGWESHFYS